MLSAGDAPPGAGAATCAGASEERPPNMAFETPCPMTDPATEPAIDEPNVPIIEGAAAACGCAIGGGGAGRAGGGAGEERLLLRPKPLRRHEAARTLVRRPIVGTERGRSRWCRGACGGGESDRVVAQTWEP